MPFGATARAARGSMRPLSTGAKIGVGGSAKLGKATQMAGRSVKGMHSPPKAMTHAATKHAGRAVTKYGGRVAK